MQQRSPPSSWAENAGLCSCRLSKGPAGQHSPAAGADTSQGTREQTAAAALLQKAGSTSSRSLRREEEALTTCTAGLASVWRGRAKQTASDRAR